ncbi:MAG: hypothetical protein IJ011_08650 [Clostridia bacterium]|nr:hypothetical protein [Clostridia bacterium]
MNGRNRHNKYRNSVYRRHNIGMIVLISVISLIALIVLFLVIGNLLHAQSERRSNEVSDTDTSAVQNNEQDNVKAPVQSITGHCVLLETDDNTFLSDRLDALVEQNILEASIPLNTKDEILLFKSDIADEIGYSVGTANVTLEKAVSTADTRNMYLSGIFYVNAFSNDDALLRSVELSRAAALIAEALAAGFDDVVIIAPHMTEEHTEEVIAFVESIRSLAPNGAVGLAVSDSILELEDAYKTSEIITRLYEKIDFLAMEVSTDDSADVLTDINNKINAEQLYLHMYKMRVLLPYNADKEIQSSIISATETGGITNWQIIQ